MSEAEIALKELVLIELRIARCRAVSAGHEIDFLGDALKRNILTASEIVEALENDIGWAGFLRSTAMEKIRNAFQNPG